MRKRRKIRNSARRTFLLIGICLLFLIIVSFLRSLLYTYNKKQVISPKSTQVKSSKNAIFIRDLQKTLVQKNIPFSSIMLATDSSVLVRFANGEKAIFSLEKPLDNQISSLQLVLSRLTIEGKRFTNIDFRFDKPIIAFD